MQFPLKTLVVPAVLMATGSEFQQEEPEQDKLVLYRSMRGLGNTYLLGRMLLSLKREIVCRRVHAPIHVKH